MNFMKVAWRDISSIFKNRFIRVSVTAIIIVPLLYSMLYLYAFWDPYSRLQDMPVAVVNLDKGSTKDEEKVNYGKDLVDKLKDNQKIGWRFVSYEEAQKGVKDKGYYAMFVVPENFSEKVLSAKSGKPEQPSILYTANEKKNFLAAQINGKVLVELKSELTKNITDEYTKVTFDSLYELKDGMQKAADGSGELKDGIVEAKDGSIKLKDGTQQLKDKVPEMKDGVTKLYDGSNQLSYGINSTEVDSKGKPMGLKNGIAQLFSGLNSAKSGAVSLDDGAAQLKEGLTNLNIGVSQLNDGLNTNAIDKDGKPLGLKNGANILFGGIKQLNDGLNTDAVDKNGKPLGLKNGANALYLGVQQIDTGINTSAVDSNGNPLGLKSGMNSIYNALTHDDVDPTKDGIGPTLKTVQVLLNAGDPASVAQAKYIVSQLVSTTSTNSTDPSKPTFLDGIMKINGGIDVLGTSVNTQILPGAQGIAGGVNQIAEAVSAQILPGSQSLSNGVAQTAAAVSTQVKPGVEALKIGSYQLKEGTSQLAPGLDTALNGASSLLDGATKLGDGSSQLKDGLNTLNGKIPELQDGANQLYDGSSKLKDGMVKLSDGSKELSDKLKEGFDKINKNLVNDSKTMSAFISEPIVMDEKPINAVKNYGTGFTPYFIPLSLWVGALMMFFVITDKVDEDIVASPRSIVLGKFLSYGYIGILQAVLASSIVMLLGLRPDNILLYFGFNIFMSLVFIAIIQCLVFLLGQVGRLLSIILLILQLTACAGTFPLEVVPKFFKVINPFMPFTYCVSALREVISGVDYAVFSKDIAVLASILVGFLAISVLMKGHADKVQDIIKEKKEVSLNSI